MGIQYYLQIFLLPIYWLSSLVSRNNKIWLFGSTFGKRFADNPKYFYLYMSQYKQKQIKAIWISEDKEIVKRLRREGYEAHYKNSFSGIVYTLLGGVYIYDNYSKDINFWLSSGAMKINLWHGIPLKKINMDNQFDEVRHPKNKLNQLKYQLRRMQDELPSHYVLTTSKFMKKIFKSAFNTNNIFTSGYPRNDILISDKIQNIFLGEEENICKNIEKLKSEGNKILLYMPTFRDSEIQFFDIMNLIKFNEYLKNNHMIFCIKLHPKSKLTTEFAKIKSENIFIIPSEADPYIFLNYTDKLITDYSSIYFDYLLKDKPIIFFDYDRETYQSQSRELYFNYKEFTPGYKVQTMEELQEKLLADDIYQEHRAKIREKVFDEKEILSSEKLYLNIKARLKLNANKADRFLRM